MRSKYKAVIILFFLFIFLSGCARPSGDYAIWRLEPTVDPNLPATKTPFLPATRVPGAPILTPTPDLPRSLPEARTESETYIVQYGDSLGAIASRFGVNINIIITANNITNPNLIEPGQVLLIPAPTMQPEGSGFKIIPDSELVYGPASTTLDVDAFVRSSSGWLKTYSEPVDGEQTSGAAIIQRISEEYSVNPRLLLAILEYQSGALTFTSQSAEMKLHPVGYLESWRVGLYTQLAWAANELNRGYYLWKVNALPLLLLPDNSAIPPNPSINAGTAAVQHLFSRLNDYHAWQKSVSAEGLFSTYQSWFGYPFDLAIEPLLPLNLNQPLMILPFEPGNSWSFTGGPHGGWGDGSGWAALDFAPPGEGQGCVLSPYWVTAVADGLIVRSENGSVIQDLDGDGYEQTGWTVLYLHIDSSERVAAGTYVKAGEPIGHASCEGGFSLGSHVHLARRYNGEWIPADGSVPFNLEGWISQGDGIEYNGRLVKNGVVVEAWDRFVPQNQIQR